MWRFQMIKRMRTYTPARRRVQQQSVDLDCPSKLPVLSQQPLPNNHYPTTFPQQPSPNNFHPTIFTQQPSPNNLHPTTFTQQTSPNKPAPTISQSHPTIGRAAGDEPPLSDDGRGPGVPQDGRPRPRPFCAHTRLGYRR